MNTETQIGIFDLFIFGGVIQGFILSYFLIKNRTKERKTNTLQGFLLLFLTLMIFEELLNNTGYIVRFLPISNFSEPLNFTLAPLIYLYFRRFIYPEHKSRTWLHFIPAFLWLGYMIFYFIQPNEFKYNSYVGTKHPDWNYLKVAQGISDDPLWLRGYVNQLTMVQFLIYIVLSISILLKKLHSLNQSFLKVQNNQLRLLRNTLLHFLMIGALYAGTKLYFGMGSDIGGYIIATYISFMLFVTTYQVMNKSEHFSTSNSFLDFPIVKYKKSSLTEPDKTRIQNKLKIAMEMDLFFKNNLASLSKLAKTINESPHHVSQVINEKYDKSFFELIAFYRIEEAKKIILCDIERKITIEELADQIGYNSKSSFNSAFKKYTHQTPSEFRRLSHKN